MKSVEKLAPFLVFCLLCPVLAYPQEKSKKDKNANVQSYATEDIGNQFVVGRIGFYEINEGRGVKGESGYSL